GQGSDRPQRLDARGADFPSLHHPGFPCHRRGTIRSRANRRAGQRAFRSLPRVREAGPDMQLYWDERAREDAYYFVDNRLDYGMPDVDRFWTGGDEALGLLLDIAGAAIDPGDVIVDIGCGLGRLTRAAASRGARVRAVDVSSEML